MTRRRRSAATALVVLPAMVAIAGCGGDSASPTQGASAVATPSPGGGPGAPVTDLAAIGCATEDPTGVGELTGAWQGNDSGVYYIRHVGDCVWWFGTEVGDVIRVAPLRLADQLLLHASSTLVAIGPAWTDHP